MEALLTKLEQPKATLRKLFVEIADQDSQEPIEAYTQFFPRFECDFPEDGLQAGESFVVEVDIRLIVKAGCYEDQNKDDKLLAECGYNSFFEFKAKEDIAESELEDMMVFDLMFRPLAISRIRPLLWNTPLANVPLPLF